jgi:twitching motility protein PilT
MYMIATQIHDLEELTRPMIEVIPRTVFGAERHEMIGEILESQSDDLRLRLREILDFYLHKMKELEASDIDMGGHGCGGHIWYRIYGDKKPMDGGPEYDILATDFLLHNVLSPRQREFLLDKKNLDFSYVLDDNGTKQRFRADMYMDLEHLGLNMRRIETKIFPFRTYNFHPEIAKALSLRYLKYGLTLVTGITGSGKSATLDAIIDANNRSVDAHIVIVASPVEMVHEPRRCIIRHREVGRDVRSFKQGAIEALRQDPDIIMLGELRDAETITTALEITDSGHKVFSTLHTASAVETIDRIIGEVPEIEQDRVKTRLADVLTCVISQKLVPSLDGKRVLAKEVLLTTPSVKAAIKNDNTSEIYQMMQEGSAYGMHTLEQDLKKHYEEGRISLEEAINYSNNKKRIKELLN